MGKVKAGKEGDDDKLNVNKKCGDENNEDEDHFIDYLRGRKSETAAVRMHVSTLLRDGSVSTRKEIVAENDGMIVTHDYFLRDRTPTQSSVLDVDHTLECQFIGHCMMQTKLLQTLLRDTNLGSKAMKGQTEGVQAFFQPIFNIHNCVTKSKVGTFNLHLSDSNLNIYKGKATQDFIRRQYSTKSGEKGGPIDFEKYYELSNVVKDGLIDADELAGKMERLILNVEDSYVHYLKNTETILAGKKVHKERMEDLTETIKQVIDKMIEGNKSR